MVIIYHKSVLPITGLAGFFINIQFDWPKAVCNSTRVEWYACVCMCASQMFLSH